MMSKWLAGQIAVLTARVRAPHECRFSVHCKVIALPAFYDAITGPTEFIISIVKIVNMQKSRYIIIVIVNIIIEYQKPAL